jgi:hypothetical protein
MAARLYIHGTCFMSRARAVVRSRGIRVGARFALRAAAGFAEGWVPGHSSKGNSDIQRNLLFIWGTWLSQKSQVCVNLSQYKNISGVAS